MVTELIKTALQCGEYELKGQFILGSNYTFLVNVHYEDGVYPAVYKPSRGEQPLWDFPENTLASREVAAYLVSEALGFNIVPFTTLRDDGPHGRWFLQQYIDYDPDYHYFNFTDEDRQLLRPLALFDLLVNNADRKGGHIFFERKTHQLYAIDHGICFHEDDKLRTVLWDFGGQKIPAELLNRLTSQPEAADRPSALSQPQRSFSPLHTGGNSSQKGSLSPPAARPARHAVASL